MDLGQLVVTGAGGAIGRALPFGRKLTRAELDVADAKQVQAVFDGLEPSGILHLAGLDIRQCQQDPELAFKVNFIGTRNVAEYAEKRGIPFIFLSSGTIFEGKLGDVFDEDSKPAPRNLYGQLKVRAETLLREKLKKHLIVRTSWVFGGHGAHHKKFVDVAIGKAKAGEPIQASNDQSGSPTYVLDLADELRKLIEAGASGVVHVANGGVATGEDLAREIVGLLKSPSRVEVKTALQIADAVENRSASEALVSKSVHLRSWQEALREYVSLQK